MANGFANPWAVAFLPDGRYLVSERSGELNLVDSDGQTQVLEGMPWSKPEGDNSRSALSRVKWKGDSLGDVEHLFVQDRASSPGRHYGSRLAWLKGSTLRLTETGEAPGDNPFVDDDDTLDEIYTMLNQIVPGNNYGWPEVSLGNDYSTNEPIGVESKPGMVDPVYRFDGRFAPSGLAEVTSDAFEPWQGSLLVFAMCAKGQMKRFIC